MEQNPNAMRMQCRTGPSVMPQRQNEAVTQNTVQDTQGISFTTGSNFGGNYNTVYSSADPSNAPPPSYDSVYGTKS